MAQGSPGELDSEWKGKFSFRLLAAFYLPLSYELFNGHIASYPIKTSLSPQGSDSAKGRGQGAAANAFEGLSSRGTSPRRNRNLILRQSGPWTIFRGELRADI